MDKPLYFIDLDGTIEDSRRDMTESVIRLRKRFNLPSLDATFIFSSVNKGMEALYLACFPEVFKENRPDTFVSLNQPETLAKLAEYYETDYADHIVDNTTMYKNMPRTLDFLAQTGTLVCFTNKPEWLSDLLLKKLEIRSFFSLIMGGDSCSEMKPSALPMQLAAEKLGYSRSTKSIMIGDSAGDMKAAKNFGAVSIWAAWGYSIEPPNDPRPDHIAREPGEIRTLLLS